MIKKISLVLLAGLLAIKINAQVNVEWVKSMGSESWDIGYAISFDAEKNVYTVGEFMGTVDFDPGAATIYFPSNGESDIFIEKFDSEGNFNWVKTIGGSGIELAFAMDIDGMGNIVFNRNLSRCCRF